jgi:hypothetical protein
MEIILALASWDREFKVWCYSYSYSQLLLRSVPKFDQDLRVDVLFSNVRFMNIPARFSRFCVDLANFEEERDRLRIGDVPAEPFNLYVVNSETHYVLATHCQWHEDREWVDAPSHFGPLRGVK